MYSESGVQLATQIVLGLCLATAAGLRAFLPLFCISLAARMGFLHLSDSFAWLSSDGVVITLGIAVVSDFLADKIPFVHHALDLVRVFLCPAAGFIAMDASQGNLDPHYGMILGLVLGMPIAAGVHVLKSAARVATTAATGGLLSPVASFGEDAGSVLICLGAAVSPYVTVIALVVCVVILARQYHKPPAPAPNSG